MQPTIKTLGLLLFLLSRLAFAAVQVSIAAVAPRWPWNGKVDITYSIECTEADTNRPVHLQFTGINQDTGEEVEMKSLTDVAVMPGGPYTATWDAAKDAPGLHASAFRVRIHAIVPDQQDKGHLYMIVDLSGGPNASSYPVRYYDGEPPDITNDRLRTTELWLRRIPAGSFTMGSPADEVGHEARETQHSVQLTECFYIGIFECTQKQWQLVMGANPSSYKGDGRPVEQVKYSMVRGTSADAGGGWPRYGHRVDANSFLGRLQAKTGLVFDLPTEAQWEYACRAGTTTAFYGGSLANATDYSTLNSLGRFAHNVNDRRNLFSFSQHTLVGLYRRNDHYLYDMHGNVWEWCLDWHDESPSPDAINPVGPTNGTRRILRGGDWQSAPAACRAAKATSLPPDALDKKVSCGFRVVFIP